MFNQLYIAKVESVVEKPMFNLLQPPLWSQFHVGYYDGI